MSPTISRALRAFRVVPRAATTWPPALTAMGMPGAISRTRTATPVSGRVRNVGVYVVVRSIIPDTRTQPEGPSGRASMTCSMALMGMVRR